MTGCALLEAIVLSAGQLMEKKRKDVVVAWILLVILLRESATCMQAYIAVMRIARGEERLLDFR